MLKVTQIRGNGRTRDGADMLNYLKATEYYKDAEGQSQEASQYQGKGAQAFGLHGVVDHDIMDLLAKGYDPNGKPLCQNAGDPTRRMGYDLTYSAPKSVSVLYADPNLSPKIKDQILQAQRRAVAEALGYIEQNAVSRRGAQGREVIPVEGLIAMEFDHFSARNAYDCQLHSHLLVPNLALGSDGKWSTFDNSVLMELQRSSGAIYRAALAAELQKIGFGIEKDIRTNKRGEETDIFFRVTGVHRDVEKLMSSRRQEIEAYMTANSVSADIACLATRKHKDEPTWAELQHNWGQIFQGIQQTAPHKLLSETELLNQVNQVGAATDAEILTKLHRNNSVFTRAQLIEEIAKENVGVMGREQILTEADAFLVRNGVVKLRDNHKGKEQFAARWMLQMEQGIVDRAEARQHDLSVRLTQAQVDAAIHKFEEKKNATLTLEQRKAVEHVCLHTGGTACLSGFAGTGKTFAALAYIQAYQDAGYQVIGTAIAGQAAKKLAFETGIASLNCAALLHQLGNGKLTLTRNTLLVLDEAGMAGSPTISALQKQCDEAGAKLVLMGDAFQLQPIEAGGAFRLAINQIGDAKLSGIQRQQNLEDRVTASAFYGIDEKLVKAIHDKTLDVKECQAQGSPLLAQRQNELEVLEHQRMTAACANPEINGELIFQRMVARNQIVECDTDQAARRQLVKDYFASAQPVAEKLVLAGTRVGVNKLNEAIREELKNRHQLTNPIMIEVVNDAGDAELKEFGVGDRIRFTQKYNELNVINGTQGIIERIDVATDSLDHGGHGFQVRIESDLPGENGRIIRFNSNAFCEMTHNYAMTVHASQGQGRNEVFSLCNANMTDRHLALVGFTRAKQAFKLYGTVEDFETIQDRFAKDRLKLTAIEQARGYQAKCVSQAAQTQPTVSMTAPGPTLNTQSTDLTLTPTEHLPDVPAPTRWREPTRTRTQVLSR